MSPLPARYATITLFWCGWLLSMFALTYMIAEPYPTFVMPGFARVFQAERDTVILEEPLTTLIDQQGISYPFSYQELWSDLHYVNPPAVMKNLFALSATTRGSIDTMDRTFYMRLKRFRSDIQMRVANILHTKSPQNRVADRNTRQWLVQQCTALANRRGIPNSTLRELRIVWHRSSCLIIHDSLFRFRTTITDSLTIPLKEP